MPRLVADVIVVATQFGGGIVAVDAATGQLRWSYPPVATEEMPWPAIIPAPADESIYVTAGFVLAALDAASGEEEWCMALESFAGQSLADNGAIYLGTDNAGMVAIAAALDARTGAVTN